MKCSQAMFNLRHFLARQLSGQPCLLPLFLLPCETYSHCCAHVLLLCLAGQRFSQGCPEARRAHWVIVPVPWPGTSAVLQFLYITISSTREGNVSILAPSTRLSAFDFILAQNQCYGWYYKPFLLRSDKTGKCALKSAVLTPVSSYLIQFTWNSMVNLTCFLLYFFLAVATNASCPLLAYCNCSCVSAGLLRFRDNLRKHLGLSAPVVLRNARRVPLQIFTSADTE